MKDNTIIWAKDFLIKCNTNDTIICFALTMGDLIKEFSKVSNKYESGIYYIYECNQFYNKQEIIKTDKYIVNI